MLFLAPVNITEEKLSSCNIPQQCDRLPALSAEKLNLIYEMKCSLKKTKTQDLNSTLEKQLQSPIRHSVYDTKVSTNLAEACKEMFKLCSEPTNELNTSMVNDVKNFTKTSLPDCHRNGTNYFAASPFYINTANLNQSSTVSKQVSLPLSTSDLSCDENVFGSHMSPELLPVQNDTLDLASSWPPNTLLSSSPYTVTKNDNVKVLHSQNIKRFLYTDGQDKYMKEFIASEKKLTSGDSMAAAYYSDADTDRSVQYYSSDSRSETPAIPSDGMLSKLLSNLCISKNLLLF